MSAVVDLQLFRQRRLMGAAPDLLHELMRECVAEIRDMRRQEDADEAVRLLRYVADVQRKRAAEARAADAKRREEDRARTIYPPQVEEEIRLLTRIVGHRLNAQGRCDYTPAECRAVAIAELLQRAAGSTLADEVVPKHPRKKR